MEQEVHITLRFNLATGKVSLNEIVYELKKRYWGRHFWGKGYCVSTVGLDEEEIKKFVKSQLNKDRNTDQLKLFEK